MVRIHGLMTSRYRVCLGPCFGNGRRIDPRYLPLEPGGWPDIEVGDQEVERSLVIRAAAGQFIAGRAIRDDGSPASFAVIHTPLKDGVATCDEDGAFRIRDIVAGTYDLTAVAPDGATAKLEKVATGRDDVEIVLPRTGALRGTVVGGKGACFTSVTPNPGVRFLAPRHTATTRAFTIPHIAAGDYQVAVTCDEGVAATEATVAPGERTDLELLVGAPGTIRGVARLFPDGSPVSGLQCSSGENNATTDNKGAFELSGVMPGQARVTCGSLLGSTYLPATQAVRVEPGGTTQTEVFIARGSVAAFAEAPQNVLGAQLEPDAQDASTLTFRDIQPGGAAAQAGIQDGDLLIAIAGRSATGDNAMTAGLYVMSRPKTSSTPITLRRGGEAIDVDLEIN